MNAKRTISTLLCLMFSLSAWSEDLSPPFRDFLNAQYSAIKRETSLQGYHRAVAEALAALKDYDSSEFTPDDAREAEAFRWEVEAAQGLALHPPLSIPSILPTPIDDGLRFGLLNGPSLDTPEGVRQWIGQLAAAPKQIAESVAWLKSGTSAPLPRILVAQLSSSLDPYLSTPAAFGELAGYFKAHVSDAALQAQVVKLLEDEVYPALRSARKRLDELAATAPAGYTLCIDPESYPALIRQELGEAVTARALHECALENLKRLSSEADFPGEGAAYSRVRAFLALEPRLSSEDYDWARGVVDASKAGVSRWYSGTPPQFEARFGSSDPVSNYVSESLDGHRPARLNLGLGSMVKSAGALTILWHEGFPGHALQMGLQTADVTLPLFRRDPWPSSFVEGWASYAEELESPSQSAAGYRASVWSGRYRRAVIVALDSGLNGLGWTYKDARAFLLKYLPGESQSYDSMINRTMYWPGQMLAYDYGYRQMVSLRDDVQKKQGAAFDLRGFHDRLLTVGALPFPLIRKEFSLNLSP